MKKKIIVIDLIGPNGHINWLNKLFSLIEKDFEVLFISYKSYSDQLIVENRIVLNDKFLPKRNRFINLIKSGIVFSKIKKILKEYDSNIPVYIVGFENISYAIFGFKKRKVLLHVHNNLSLSKLSLIFFKHISKNNTFIVYEGFIKMHLESLSNEIYVLNHSLNFKPENKYKSFENYIFIPSKIDDLNLLDTLINFAKTKNLKIIFKSDFEVNNHEILISKPFFKNYIDLLMNCKYVAIISSHNYRVSGVFYEAMSYNKKIKIIGDKGIFIKEMMKIYPNSFENSEIFNKIDIFDNKNKKDDHDRFISNHHDFKIKKQFKKIINEFK